MKLKITIHGVAYEVDVEVLDAGAGFPGGPLPAMPAPKAPTSGGPSASAAPLSNLPAPGSAGGTVLAPIAGVVLELPVKAGDKVSRGQTVIVVEAMKMKTNIAATAAGTVKAVLVAPGDSVREGQALVDIAD